jgi:hypothetical protein
MLASFPASMVNQKPGDLGIPNRFKLNSSRSSQVSQPLILGLPTCRPNMAAGFMKWRIVLGEGTTKRELTRIETNTKLED